MARIRTIKPEFFTDERLIECSTSARLLFVGCLCFADDEGNMDRSAKQIKAQVFPVDAIDCEPLLQELLTCELLVEYSSSGKNFLHIRSFKKHQKIDRPSKPRFPEYDGSLNTRRILVEPSLPEGKGREGKGSITGPGGPRSAGAEHPVVSLPNALENHTSVKSINREAHNDGKLDQSDSSRKLRAAAKEILAYLNRATGKKFHEVDSNLEPIIARIKEGATPEQIKSVVVDRVQAWGADEKMHEFLRPDTLFRRSKFWNYLGNITALDKESPSRVESTADRLTKSTGRQPGDDDGS